MSFDNLFGTAVEFGALGMILDTTKEILEPEKKKKKKVEPDTKEQESFW